MVTGLLLTIWEQGFMEAVFFLLALLGVISLFFPLFLLRMIGAGDIKMMAVVCGYLGIYRGGLLISYGFLAAALFSAVKLVSNNIFYLRFSYFFAYFRRLFLTKKISPYYLADRDGDLPAIHFAVCLWLGWWADMLQRRMYL